MANSWEIPIKKSGTRTLTTANKFVDRNIEVLVQEAELKAISNTITGEVELEVPVSVGAAKVEGKYVLEGSVDKDDIVTTGGVTVGTDKEKYGFLTPNDKEDGDTENTKYSKYIEVAGSVSANATASGTLDPVGLSVSCNVDEITIGKNDITVDETTGNITATKNITGNAKGYVNSEGYGRDEETTKAIEGTINVNIELESATFPNPTEESENVTDTTLTLKSVGAKTAENKYPLTINIDSMTPLSLAAETGGFVAKDEVVMDTYTACANYDSTEVEINAANLTSSSSIPEGYEENTSVVVPSQGYLRIDAGYVPNTVISLDQILDGKEDTAGIASTDIRKGAIAYDVDGKKLTGDMEDTTRTAGNGEVSATGSISLGDMTDVEPEADFFIEVRGAGSVSTGTGYISEGTTKSNTAIAYYPVASAEVTNTDRETDASTSTTLTATLVEGTYTDTATEGYSYAVTASATASVTDTIAKAVISAGYTSGATATATITGSSAEEQKTVYIKDSTARLCAAPGGANVIKNAGESSVIPAGNYVYIEPGYYPTAREYQAAAEAPKSGITGSITAEGLTLLDSAEGLASYVTITGNGSMTTGNIYDGTSTPSVKYLEVYNGDWS